MSILKNKEKTIHELLQTYKDMIDFDDSMLKNNFKWVTQFIRFQQRKKREHWRDECILLLTDVIEIHKKSFGYKN